MPRDPATTRERARRRRAARKDRLIQTRVAEDLEQTLKREAARRRLTVSHLIRNTLEDTFNLVQNVTDDVNQIVTGSVELAAAVSRDARRFADIVRGRPIDEQEGIESSPSSSDALASVAGETNDAVPTEQDLTETTETPEVRPESAEDVDLSHVYGWNEVIANRPAECARCQAPIEKGDDALVGLSDDPKKPRAWLCVDCGEEL